MHRNTARVVMAVALGLFSAGDRSLGVENWPEFRGPTGDGQAPESQLATVWSESQNVHWKTAIPGLGWSSPVIWGDQIWLTTATPTGKDMFALCVDLDSGKVVHNVQIFHNEFPRYRHPTNSYASPTPVVESGRVYVHFGSYGTACLDTRTGQKLWERRDLPCNHWRGPGSSLAAYGDRLFVAFDGYDYQYIVALDKRTGETVWRRDRDIDYGTDNGDLKKAYSTCTIIRHAGRTQVISPSSMETIAYDADTGETIWRVRHGGYNAAARPLFGHGLVYVAPGDNASTLVAIRTDGEGDVTGTHVAWQMRRSAPKRPSPVLVGDYLYMVNDEGVASCVAARTGEIVWRQRLPGTYRASPIHASGKLYFFNLEGDGLVVAAEPTFRLLARNPLHHGCQASPAVSGNRLIVRTIENLYSIGDDTTTRRSAVQPQGRATQ